MSTDRISRFERRFRHLPHWEELGAAYFVTFVLRRPPVVALTDPGVGRLVVNALRFYDGKRYTLFDYTIMPDHVHLIVKPVVHGDGAERLPRVIRDLKAWLGREINAMLDRRGRVWQDESYDHILRNEADYWEKAKYIYENPHRKGLVADPAQWPWWGRGSGAGTA